MVGQSSPKSCFQEPDSQEHVPFLLWSHHVCVYIYIYICIYICNVYVYIYIYIYIYVYMYYVMCTYTYIYIYIYTYIYIYGLPCAARVHLSRERSAGRRGDKSACPSARCQCCITNSIMMICIMTTHDQLQYQYQYDH